MNLLIMFESHRFRSPFNCIEYQMLEYIPPLAPKTKAKHTLFMTFFFAENNYVEIENTRKL